MVQSYEYQQSNNETYIDLDKESCMTRKFPIKIDLRHAHIPSMEKDL